MKSHSSLSLPPHFSFTPLLLLFFFSLFTFHLSPFTLNAQTDWKKVERLLNEGSYKSAYTEAEAVYKKTRNSNELLTAAWYMSRAAAEYQEDYYDSTRARYRAILPRLDAVERSICYAFLGVYDSALLDEEVLKRTPSDRILRFCDFDDDFAEDIKEGSINITPTVYDVVVRSILGNGYQYHSTGKEYFELFQKLVDFHSNDSEELRMCLDLEWLDDIHDAYNPPYNDKIIQTYINKYRGSKSPLLTTFYYEMAHYLNSVQRYVEAVNYCDTAVALAPKSYGGALCINLKNEISAARIHFQSGYNSTVYPDQPSLQGLTYRNLKRICFAVYPFEGDWSKKFFEKLPQPVKQWQLDVVDDGTYRENNIYFEMPALPTGHYLLMASPDGKMDNQSAHIEIHSTDLMVARNGSVFQLFDAHNGTPIIGQRVDFYRENRSDTTLIDSAYSDATGRVDYKDKPSSITLKIKRGGIVFKKDVYHYRGSSSNREMHSSINLMSDRPIYRPGDTVHFAALCYRADGIDGEVLPKIKGEFRFRDPNYKQKDTLGFTTDDHGLASAFFVIPADALGGSWTVECFIPTGVLEKSIRSSIRVRVEEYKQPKFMVSLDDDSDFEHQVPQFGEPYTIRGIARAYNGASLAGARVLYVINRDCYDWRYGSLISIKAVASDTLQVSADGTFDITFTPEPDSAIDLSLKPNFQFEVMVEVTDLNGETHYATTDFRIGFQNRILSLSGVKDNTSSLASISYSLSDLNYNPVKGTVNVTVQRLAAGKPLLAHPLYYNFAGATHTLTREEFHEHFPGFYYTYDEIDFDNRAVEWTYNVSHTADGNSFSQTVPLPESKMKSGVYRIVVSIDDLADTTYTTLTLPNERRVQPQPTNELFWYNLSSTSCEVGDRITLSYASAFDDVRIFYTLTGPDGEERDSRWLPAGSTIKQLSIPVDTSLLGGFSVNLTAVKKGVVCNRSMSINVPFSHKALKVDIATFRDKLQPGEQEEWTIKVGGRKSEVGGSYLIPHTSTLILTMFDDALSSYGYSDGSWSLYPWRGNHGRGYSDWLTLGFSSYTYNAFTEDKKEIGYSPEPLGFILKQGFFSYGGYRWRKSAHIVESSATARGEDGMVSNAKVDSLATGCLKGTVTDEKTGEELPFVNVIVKQNGKQVSGGTTDFDGVYIIKHLKEGTYDIEMATVGYQSYKRTGVKVLSTGFTVVDIQLHPTATNLEEVQIVYDKVPMIEIGAPESGQRLSSEDISYMSGNSVESIVAAVGGMGYSDGDQQEVQIRTNLNTYAFFVAGLHTDSTGTATYRFTVPELLTRWKVKGLAYTDDLKSGNLERTLVTQKSLMVQPNIPRFLRHGDSIVLMAKVILNNEELRNKNEEFPVVVNLLLTDAATGDTITLQQCQVTVKDAAQVTFPILVPNNVYVATYQISAVAQGGALADRKYSDGERGQIPVVSSRQAVTLSQPVYINGKGEKNFTFHLSPLTSTATPHFLAAELTTDPMWLAVKSMPYLKEQENPSTVYLANSLYVNTLASTLLKDLRGLKNLADTTNTRLKINEDVKQTLLEATPWLRDAQSEVEQHQALAAYFDSARITNELSTLEEQIRSRQNADGGWSWMPDGESSTWITMQVLKRLVPCAEIMLQQTQQALAYVDKEEQRYYEKYIKAYLKKGYNWQPDNIEYLYTRSFYGKGSTEAYKFYYKNALKNYKKYNGLYTQAQLALIFQRHGDKKAARDLIRRLKEKSLESDEMGMYWRDNRSGWCWYERPIETQALLIQAFREVTPKDTVSVGLMQQWLLKQKQTTHWGNDRATVEAINALMPQSTQNIPNTQNNPVSLILFDTPLTAPSEGLEGYRSQRWTGADLDTLLTHNSKLITLKKETSGIAWGAVYFQYTDDMDKVPSTESGITLKRTYIHDGPWKVGDRVKVRIEISVDRNMEYLELIDGRPSCVEPLSTRAGWCWNQGLRYYVEVKNTATHCYINRLEKGKYVVEYEVYVTNPGTFLAGPVTMQCMYAPEFRATAPAQRLSVE